MIIAETAKRTLAQGCFFGPIEAEMAQVMNKRSDLGHESR
jgi:hypothetical protein